MDAGTSGEQMIAWFAHHLVTVYVILAVTAVAGIAQCVYLVLAVPVAVFTILVLALRWARREHV